MIKGNMPTNIVKFIIYIVYLWIYLGISLIVVVPLDHIHIVYYDLR